MLRFLEGTFSSVATADHEDLVQEALLILIRNKEQVLPDDDGLYRYIRRVAKNAALDLTKSAAYQKQATKHTVRSRVPVGPPAPKRRSDEPQLVDPTPASPSAQAQSQKNEEILQIRKIFCELDDLNRLVLWSYVVDGQSVNAIAKQLGIGWHRVAYIIEHSLNRLRRHLS
ncbi:MAG: hypothetical protein DHS20C16_19550 [Phycisphaerae bacterium]|nr:MAG: hypothetical protein DHS20C16_19550 [Phycisphaerae bacterium]